MAASQTLRTLKLSLLADVSDFGKGMGNATSDFQKFERGVASASRVASGVIGAIGAIGVSSINAASDLAETSSAVEAVFGRRSAAQLQTFAAAAAQALGQSRQDALQAAQQFGIFGQAAGLAGDDLVDFTTELVTLASDLASFNNTSVDQAITALGAALRGESEPIRTYGVLLDAATLQARAFSEGLIEAENEALDPATRVLAAYNEILAQTTTQQGDFARTSDGLANSSKTVKAEIENFRVEVGEELLPVVQQLLPELRGIVTTFAETDPETIVRIGEAVGVLAASIVALNAALRVFATLKATAALLGIGTGAVAAGVVAAGAGVVALSARGAFSESAQADIERRVQTGDTRFGFSSGQYSGPGSFTAPVVVNVSGVVGSTYQVQREIERQLEALQRNRLGFPANAN